MHYRDVKELDEPIIAFHYLAYGKSWKLVQFSGSPPRPSPVCASQYGIIGGSCVFFSLDDYDSANSARMKLALPYPPEFKLPVILYRKKDQVRPAQGYGTVQPLPGLPGSGGGTEIVTPFTIPYNRVFFPERLN